MLGFKCLHLILLDNDNTSFGETWLTHFIHLDNWNRPNHLKELFKCDVIKQSMICLKLRDMILNVSNFLAWRLHLNNSFQYMNQAKYMYYRSCFNVIMYPTPDFIGNNTRTLKGKKERNWVVKYTFWEIFTRLKISLN